MYHSTDDLLLSWSGCSVQNLSHKNPLLFPINPVLKCNRNGLSGNYSFWVWLTVVESCAEELKTSQSFSCTVNSCVVRTIRRMQGNNSTSFWNLWLVEEQRHSVQSDVRVETRDGNVVQGRHAKRYGRHRSRQILVTSPFPSICVFLMPVSKVTTQILRHVLCPVFCFYREVSSVARNPPRLSSDAITCDMYEVTLNFAFEANA